MRWPLRRQILLPMVGILLLTVGIVSALNACLADRPSCKSSSSRSSPM